MEKSRTRYLQIREFRTDASVSLREAIQRVESLRKSRGGRETLSELGWVRSPGGSRPDEIAQAHGKYAVQFVFQLTPHSIFLECRTKGLGMDALGIALSGMQGAETRIAVSAHNVANLLTEDFRPQRAEQMASRAGGSETRVRQATRPEPVSLEREIVGQIQAKAQYIASARVFAVGAEMRGSLLDLFA